MHANRLMPNVYRKKLLAFTIMPRTPPNTPAYAGKTQVCRHINAVCGKHPRICGGVSLSVSRKSASTRYSPHVRGCVSFSVFFSSRGLGFQACAGVCPKFPPFWQSQPCFPACAEVCLSKPPIQLASTGLPRICVDDLWNLTEAYCSIVHPRIRGEYSPSLQRTGKSKVHPRMRGEDEFIVPYSRPAIGSPPRSRGIFIDNLESLLAARFTPAFAGNIAAS